jgi:DnaJ-class molecular chaperone
MTELTQRCHRCGGSGNEVAGDGVQKRLCPECKGLGRLLGDEVSNFIHALLRDDDIYHRIRQMAEKLKADINNS